MKKAGFVDVWIGLRFVHSSVSPFAQTDSAQKRFAGLIQVVHGQHASVKVLIMSR